MRSGRVVAEWHRDYGRSGDGAQWQWSYDHPTLCEDAKLFVCLNHHALDQVRTERRTAHSSAHSHAYSSVHSHTCSRHSHTACSVHSHAYGRSHKPTGWRHWVVGAASGTS